MSGVNDYFTAWQELRSFLLREQEGRSQVRLTAVLREMDALEAEWVEGGKA